ncbi:glycosyltransferase family 39 protein [Candidatus Microgenomates bacterium]|nr:glycosyltransferase family 39 protein [Candidatus Microgenomates bacterium]
MSKKIIITLALITFLGGLLRFRDITTNPPNINTDEAAIGYNAYSLLKTGRDEYGQPWPLAFRSFDDYKPPLYIYLTVPSVAAFGLNEFSVRFPSAFLGTVAIIVTFFLTKKLLGNQVTALFASFLLATSPWHLQFTRTAYETGSNAFFTSLGLLLFLKGLEKKWYWLLAGIVFGLQTHLYQASKIFVPLLLLCLFVIYLPRLRAKILSLFLFGAPFLAIFLPVVFLATTTAGVLRFQGTSIFQDPKSHDRQLAIVTTDWLANDNKSVRLFHPESLTYYQDILTGYLSHFRPDFLLTSRDSSKITYVPEVGLMFLWEFPFLLAGLYYLFHRRDKTATALLVGWFLISPIPASVTTGLPNSVRTAIFLPVIQIITAYGLINLFPKLWRPLKISIVLFALYSLAFYGHMLFVHAPISASSSWYSGYKKIVLDSIALSSRYEKVIVTTLLDQPQIFYLFYLQTDPKTYQMAGGTVGGGFGEQGNHIANKYYFHSINWFELENEPNLLLVAAPREVPIEARKRIIGEYRSLDGTLLAYFLKT